MPKRQRPSERATISCIDATSLTEKCRLTAQISYWIAATRLADAASVCTITDSGGRRMNIPVKAGVI